MLHLPLSEVQGLGEQESLVRCLQTVDAPELGYRFQKELAVPLGGGEGRRSPGNLTPNFCSKMLVVYGTYKSLGNKNFLNNSE